MPVDPKTGKEYPYTEEGIEQHKKDTGGMPYAPFKMKGSPMQRNFGIGSPAKDTNPHTGMNPPHTGENHPRRGVVSKLKDKISTFREEKEKREKERIERRREEIMKKYEANVEKGINVVSPNPKGNIDFLETDYAKGQGVGPRIPKKDKTKEGERSGKLSRGVEHPDAQYPGDLRKDLGGDQLPRRTGKNLTKKKTLLQRLQEKKDKQKVFKKL